MLLGAPIRLPEGLTTSWPELAEARYRSGGLLPRIAGWLLGAPHVAGIVLGRTVWLDPSAAIHDVGLLLHEIRHVQQFRSVPWFALRYAWQTVRNGYERNRYEVDARDYAARHSTRAVFELPAANAEWRA